MFLVSEASSGRIQLSREELNMSDWPGTSSASAIKGKLLSYHCCLQAVLLIPRSKVWDLLAPTTRPFFSARRVGGGGSQHHCDDNALGTLASHFFSNALSSLVAQRDRSRHQNAYATIYLIMQAIPSSRAGSDVSLLVSALKFSYLYNEGRLFNYVSSHMAGDHNSVKNLATAVRNVTPLLADGPRGLLQAFAAESYVQGIPSNSHLLYGDQCGPVC